MRRALSGAPPGCNEQSNSGGQPGATSRTHTAPWLGSTSGSVTAAAAVGRTKGSPSPLGAAPLAPPWALPHRVSRYHSHQVRCLASVSQRGRVRDSKGAAPAVWSGAGHAGQAGTKPSGLHRISLDLRRLQGDRTRRHQLGCWLEIVSGSGRSSRFRWPPIDGLAEAGGEERPDTRGARALSHEGESWRGVGNEFQPARPSPSPALCC